MRGCEGGGVWGTAAGVAGGVDVEFFRCGGGGGVVGAAVKWGVRRWCAV